MDLDNKDLWALLTEYHEINCRDALVKRIMNDISSNTSRYIKIPHDVYGFVKMESKW
ncbi:MAG: hypothetical protein ACTSR5_10600 [Promethearchaeota archaeon]